MKSCKKKILLIENNDFFYRTEDEFPSIYHLGNLGLKLARLDVYKKTELDEKRRRIYIQLTQFNLVHRYSLWIYMHDKLLRYRR